MKGLVTEQFAKERAEWEAMHEGQFDRARRGLAPGGDTADYHLQGKEQRYYRLIEKARHMDRNDSLIGQMIDRSVANIVQDGFTLHWDTGDAKLDLDLWAMWDAFSKDPTACDIAQEMTFCDYERAVMRSETVDGDCVVVGTEDGPLQFIEAHSIKNPSKTKKNFVLGVEIDEYRTHIAYHLGNSAKLQVRDSDGVRQVFHIYDKKRTSSTRGVTRLAPIFSMAGMLGDVNFSKLVQQQVASCFAIFRQQAATQQGESTPTTVSYGESSVETSTSGTRYIEGISPGMEFVGKPGEELKGFSPNIPNSEYFQQVRLIVSIMGSVFDLPFCMATLDFQGENFVGYRGAIDEARKGFKGKQRNLIQRFHNHVVEWKIARECEKDSRLLKAIQRQKKKVPGKLYLWQPRSFPYVEPVNDAAGALLRVRNNLTSWQRLHAEDGKDFDDISSENVRANGSVIRKSKQEAAAINEEFPDDDPVSWRDVMSLPTADGIQVAVPQPQPQSTQGSVT